MSSAKRNAAAKPDGAEVAVEHAAPSGPRQRPRKPGRGKDFRSDGCFVPYLPHEDAVAAGLGEWKGGIDVSASQEVTDLLNAELSALLRLKPHQFWKHATTDESLQKYLESYLRFRRRWYDFTPVQNGEVPVGIVVGDNDLYCRTFKVLYRMSSFHESRAASAEISQAKEPARMLFEKGILDVPKLMDICAIYGHDNPDLTRRLVSNVLSSIPNVADEISAIVPPLVHTVDTMHRRCQNALQEFMRAETSTSVVDSKRLKQQLVEVLDYLNDVVATISAFINAYPMAAPILATFAAPSNVQGPFLPFLAGIHDSLLPLLWKGVSATLYGPRSSSTKEQRESQNFTQLRFRRLRIHLVSLTWNILRLAYLGNFVSSSSSGASDKERPRGVQGDFVIQAVVSLAIGVEDKENFSFGSAGGLLKLNCTGAMLKTIENRYGLCERIRDLCHTGEIILDDAQYEYLAALAIEQEPDMSKTTSNIPALQESSRDNLKENTDQPLSAGTQLKVQEVRDIFPAFGTGFILACLEVYDNDPESVIQNILEGTLYPDLACLETWLEIRPSGPISGPSGKDKGKKIQLEEQPRTVSKTPASVPSASSSVKVFPKSGVANLCSRSSEMEGSATEAGQPAWPAFERIVRNGIETQVKQVEALNITPVVTQLEYDDEYDDSFDDLVTYPADTGLEETGNLDDIIAHSRGFDAGTAGAWRRQEDPGVGPSWSRNHRSGERRRSKSEAGQDIISSKSAFDGRARPGILAESSEDSGRVVRMHPPNSRGNTAGRGHQMESRLTQPSTPQYKPKAEVETPSVKSAVVEHVVDDSGMHSFKPDSAEALAISLGDNSGLVGGVPVVRGDERSEGIPGGGRGRGAGYRRRREHVVRTPATSLG